MPPHHPQALPAAPPLGSARVNVVVKERAWSAWCHLGEPRDVAAVDGFLPFSGNQGEGSGSLEYGGIEDGETQVSVGIGNLEL